MFRKVVFVTGIYATALSVAAFAQTAQDGTDEEAIAMLERAVAAVKADKAAALEMFNKGTEGFKDGDLYVSCANASDGIVTAHPTHKGKKLSEMEDSKGFAFGREIIRSATEGKIREIGYMWPRPGTDTPEKKITFFSKVGDQICAVGYFGSAGRCGGTGGDNVTSLTCPNGQYIAALAVRGNGFTDLWSIACREIPVHGQSGPLGNYMSAGPGGGTITKDGSCKRGDAVSSIYVRSGWYVDYADRGWCASRSGDGWSPANYWFDLKVGGWGGSPCLVDCPTGEAMYKLTVRWGGWIDSIRGDCRR
jgi:hypothetical protein